MERCDIVIPVWNELESTRDCVDSIRKNTRPPFRLIIIDNGSGPQTKEYLEGLRASAEKNVILIRNEKNAGFVKAANQGMRISEAEYVCIVNNDTLVTDGWLDTMIYVAEKDKVIGIVNPSSNNLGQKPAAGESIDSYAAGLKREGDKYVELGAAIGFCMLIKRAVIDKIGVFDEIYGMGNFEDTDFSRKAVSAGYKCVRACGAYVYHRENTSFKRLEKFDDDFKRNREIYEFRWGRPRRIAYILDAYDKNVLKKIQADSLKLARGGNWVSYYSEGHVEMPEHSNIIFQSVRAKNFYLRTIGKILTKKKKFDEIVVGSERFGKLLSWLSFIHKARVNYY